MPPVAVTVAGKAARDLSAGGEPRPACPALLLPVSELGSRQHPSEKGLMQNLLPMTVGLLNKLDVDVTRWRQAPVTFHTRFGLSARLPRLTRSRVGAPHTGCAGFCPPNHRRKELVPVTT